MRAAVHRGGSRGGVRRARAACPGPRAPHRARPGPGRGGGPGGLHPGMAPLLDVRPCRRATGELAGRDHRQRVGRSGACPHASPASRGRGVLRGGADQSVATDLVLLRAELRAALAQISEDHRRAVLETIVLDRPYRDVAVRPGHQRRRPCGPGCTTRCAGYATFLPTRHVSSTRAGHDLRPAGARVEPDR